MSNNELGEIIYRRLVLPLFDKFGVKLYTTMQEAKNVFEKTSVPEQFKASAVRRTTLHTILEHADNMKRAKKLQEQGERVRLGQIEYAKALERRERERMLANDQLQIPNNKFRHLPEYEQLN